MALTTRSLPTLVNLQARILEKQESVQERKAKRKVPWPPSSLSCTLKHLIGTGENIRDSRGSAGDQGCAGDEGAGGAPFLHLLQTDSHEKWEDWSTIEVSDHSGKFIYDTGGSAGDEGSGCATGAQSPSTLNRCQSHHGNLPMIHGPLCTYLLAIQAKTPDELEPVQEMEEQVCFSFVSCCTHENL